MPLPALFLLAFASDGSAVLVNHTIDDQFGDPVNGIMPVYFPADQWSQGATCVGCTVRPLASKAFDGTWHDTTYVVTDGKIRSITISFKGASGQLLQHCQPHTYNFVGSAIYAFFITAPYIPGANAETHLNISLDGQFAGTYNYVPGETDPYQYNVSVYSNPNIPMGLHTLLMSTGGSTPAILEFDYAVYTSAYHVLEVFL